MIKRMRPSIHNQWKSDEVCAYPLGKGQVRDYWGGGGGGGTGGGCGGEISGLTPFALVSNSLYPCDGMNVRPPHMLYACTCTYCGS